MSVGLNPKQLKNKKNLKRDDYLITTPSSDIPGTQTIYMKTFRCSHNQSESEYMAGQLLAFGYALRDNPEEADLWLINTCSGVLKELEGVSVVRVQQIDCVVEVVEETLMGHEVCLLNCKILQDLTKVRKNNFIEILLIKIEHTLREVNRAPDHIEKLASAMGHFDLDVSSFDATLVQICDEDKKVIMITERERMILGTQRIRLQETPDEIPDGGTPHTVTGVYRVMSAKNFFKTYIDCLYLKKTNKSRMKVEHTIDLDNGSGDKDDDVIPYDQDKVIIKARGSSLHNGKNHDNGINMI
ncbi:hypothetical protein GIB67_008181 [Kingdonia uniflora]|uniref:MTTase N-terminal domain-containing protein n=1 Tax=Kingdonia uniflora TaxID=39325 RepID=A0A7J7LUP3_9MAGN|nr:hypothetical protein GIB67_008181 [Kingdonia uniflora]